MKQLPIRSRTLHAYLAGCLVGIGAYLVVLVPGYRAVGPPQLVWWLVSLLAGIVAVPLYFLYHQLLSHWSTVNQVVIHTVSMAAAFAYFGPLGVALGRVRARYGRRPMVLAACVALALHIALYAAIFAHPGGDEAIDTNARQRLEDTQLGLRTDLDPTCLVARRLPASPDVPRQSPPDDSGGTDSGRDESALFTLADILEGSIKVVELRSAEGEKRWGVLASLGADATRRMKAWIEDASDRRLGIWVDGDLVWDIYIGDIADTGSILLASDMSEAAVREIARKLESGCR